MYKGLFNFVNTNRDYVCKALMSYDKHIYYINSDISRLDIYNSETLTRVRITVNDRILINYPDHDDISDRLIDIFNAYKRGVLLDSILD